jgi:anti-sigma B factor antagonist
MDSAGIGEHVACHKRAIEKSGTLKLLNPSGKVYDLLMLTKLDEVFETFREEKEALVSFTG